MLSSNEGFNVCEGLGGHWSTLEERSEGHEIVRTQELDDLKAEARGTVRLVG